MSVKILLLFFVIFISSPFPLLADEGMWIPILLKQLNESDMKNEGLRLSAEDIYSINQSSLKDAVVQFGGGCTAEVISDKGLLLTNHHCGYGSIQSHSSVEHDYLTDGYWAKNNAEELQTPGLSVSFIVRMEDVTSKVLNGIPDNSTEKSRDSIITISIKKLEGDAVKGTHYEAFVRPFFYGNEYYLFLTETFKDIRLVGAPPSSIGKFGGDTDNWMWPRHTGDFSLFRIYANKNNEPAPYSVDNVPYTPKYHLTISLKDIQENDFTMVYGFPGRTSEYITSNAVDLLVNESNPVRIKIREKRLSILSEDMKLSDELRIKYSAKYAGISNAYKKYLGQNTGLKKLDAIEKKRSIENKFNDLSLKNNKAEYIHLLQDFDSLYIKLKPLNKYYEYYSEGIQGIEIINYAANYNSLIDKLSAGSLPKEELIKNLEKLKMESRGYFKNYNSSTDKKILAALLSIYYQDVDKNAQCEIFREIEKKFKGDFNKYADYVFENSFMTSQEKVIKTLDHFDFKKVKKDPAFLLMRSLFDNYNKNVKNQYFKLLADINQLNRIYMKGQMELFVDKKFYPDANSTLRVAFGKVADYTPRDAVNYDYYTTLKGLMEKENPMDEEFIVAPRLKELYQKKDYGRYADTNNELHIAFIASNHTTGGNSGSPVLNGLGQLIGTNFDRNWEGTMSDVMYDPGQVRNIVLDIHYTLFVIEKFANSKYLVDEMTVVK